MLSLILMALVVLIRGSNSAVVVNNVTVSSDVLSELFFNAIKNIQDKIDISTEDLNAYKCFLTLWEILKRLPDVDILPFFDSWGRIPSGMLKGHLFDIGNFDECVETSVILSTEAGLANGQYCIVSIPINQTLLGIPPMIQTRNVDMSIIENMLKINIGICVPDSCRSELINRIFQSFASNVFDGALSGIKVHSCSDGEVPELEAIHIIGITVFGLIAALMILSSICEAVMTSFNKTPSPILLAFSMISNGRKMFAINSELSLDVINCLPSIRVFSMIWIFYCHSHMYTFLTPLINTSDAEIWLKQAWTMHLINATVSVDSFLFISGLLVAWLGFKELDRTNGNLNVIKMYVHRYIRLTPSFAAVILFAFSLNKLIGTGPFRQLLGSTEKCDKYNWWPLPLYLQNYIVYDPGCCPYSWYLAIDFQLYVLSPLVLVPMWKWKRKFAPVLVILSLLSIGCVIGTYLVQGYTDLAGFFNPNEWEKTYVPLHTRYSPWLVGFGLGYFMHIHRGKTIHLPMEIKFFGWVISLSIIGSIIFGPTNTITRDFFGTVVEAAMYEALKRVSWAIALAWITFACHFGYGGVVDSILSHPIWQPLGRLTYALYLIHIPMLRIYLGSMRTERYLSHFREILSFWSVFGISLPVAIVLSLAFESPVLALEKVFFGRGRQETRPSADPITVAPAVVESVPESSA